MLEKIFSNVFNPKNVMFCIAVILFIFFIAQMQDIAIMFFASYVIACSLEPLAEKLSKKYKRSIACAITLLCVLLVIGAFIIPLVILAGYQIKNFAVAFPHYMNNLELFLGSLPFISTENISQIDINGVLTSASGVTSDVLNEIMTLSKNIGSAFIYFLASLLIIYYFMADKDTVQNAFIRLFPTNLRKRAKEISDTISKKIGGYIIALLATMLCIGLIMTLGLFILRVEDALLLGLITSVLDIIPVIGPAIALVICLLATYHSGWGIMALVILVFSIAQLTENNFVRPYVFGKFLDLHPLIIYLFIFIAAKYMGVVGVIFAPAIAATVVVLIEEIYIKGLEEK